MTQQRSAHPADTVHRDLVLPYINMLRRLVEETANLYYLGRLPDLPHTLLDAYWDAKVAIKTWDELSDTC